MREIYFDQSMLENPLGLSPDSFLASETQARLPFKRGVLPVVVAVVLGATYVVSGAGKGVNGVGSGNQGERNDPGVTESTHGYKLIDPNFNPIQPPTLGENPAIRVMVLTNYMELHNSCPPAELVGPEFGGKFADPQVIGRTCPGK